MGATLIVGDPELVPALPGTHLATSEGWTAESAVRHKESSIAALDAVTDQMEIDRTGNRTRTTCMAVQQITHYTTGAITMGV